MAKNKRVSFGELRRLLILLYLLGSLVHPSWRQSFALMPMIESCFFFPSQTTIRVALNMAGLVTP
jgi:hypothetical protein